MGPWDYALFGFGGLLLLMAIGMPIAFAMLISGAAGLLAVLGPRATLGMIGQMPVSTTTSYDLSVVPMFILMGALVTRARMSEDLYRTCHAFVGHWRGGLAMATIIACGGFSAVSGSSIATAATMAKVALPQMRAYRYDAGLASGAVAAGGTLGILIPPSVILVIYGIATGTDIGLLFIAGILPGLVAILLYMAAIAVVTRLRPDAALPAERAPWRERLSGLRHVGPIMALFLLIIGGIYLGVFTPTEAAGVGAFGALLFALWRRSLSGRGFLDAVVETARTTASLFIVLIGALIFSNFINVAGLPAALEELVLDVGVSPTGVVLAMVVLYLVLGCFLESLSMVLLTVPIFFPVVTALGMDPIWFGILVVMVTELSLITPPVGLNLFVIRGVAGDLPLGTVYRGILPFVAADVVRVLLLIALPQLALVLPRLAAQ